MGRSNVFKVPEAALKMDPPLPPPRTRISPEPESHVTDLLDELRIRVVELAPEDILVIESKRVLGEEGRDRLRDVLEHHLPDIRAIVLDGDLTLRAVLRKLDENR